MRRIRAQRGKFRVVMFENGLVSRKPINSQYSAAFSVPESPFPAIRFSPAAKPFRAHSDPVPSPTFPEADPPNPYRFPCPIFGGRATICPNWTTPPPTSAERIISMLILGKFAATKLREFITRLSAKNSPKRRFVAKQTPNQRKKCPNHSF